MEFMNCRMSNGFGVQHGSTARRLAGSLHGVRPTSEGPNTFVRTLWGATDSLCQYRLGSGNSIARVCRLSGDARTAKANHRDWHVDVDVSHALHGIVHGIRCCQRLTAVVFRRRLGSCPGPPFLGVKYWTYAAGGDNSVSNNVQLLQSASNARTDRLWWPLVERRGSSRIHRVLALWKHLRWQRGELSQLWMELSRRLIRTKLRRLISR